MTRGASRRRGGAPPARRRPGGAREATARRPASARLLDGSRLFDAAWYLSTNPDVAAARLDPVEHYLEFGAAEGRDPSPFFDAEAYLAGRADVAAGGLNPLVHFLSDGIAESEARGPDELLDRMARLGVSLADARPGPDPAPARRRSHGPRAVFVTHDASVTGAPAVLASVAAWFARHTDYDLRIVCMTGGPWLERFEAIAPTFVVGSARVPDAQIDERRAALRRFVGAAPAFTFLNSVASGGYCRVDPFDAPRFAYVHELRKVVDRFPAQAALLKAGADHVFCDGAAVAAALAEAPGFEEGRLGIRECFIDVEGQAPAILTAARKAELRAEMGWPAEAKLVMGCGTVHWRKQPDVFVRLAEAVGGDARFVWIGGGTDLEEMRALALSLGVADRVEFLGHRDDFRALMRCADVFALTSSEDPFPLVCLEAAVAGAPSVIFREAGGMGALVEPPGEPPAGRAVPLGDEAAFAGAVRALLEDDAERAALAGAARARVLARYTTERACLDILATIRRVAGLAPRVSILVPTYQSAAHLPERLDSIAAQTFKDVEIVLRDDASRDDSPAMLEAFARSHPFARLERAERNGGSVFRAWERCLEMAQGDLVWIAEADDTCEPDFLERAVEASAPSGVRLVHGRAIPVDASGAVAGDYARGYLAEIAPGRWDRSYCAPAREEVDAALGRGNAIPNASAVVVRRGAALRAIEVARDFRLAGDWAFYLAAIHGGRIAFAADAVCRHRRHDATVTHGLEGTDLYFRELADAGALVRRLYGPEPGRDAALARRLEGEARRFGRTAPPPEGRVPAAARRPRPPGVLFGVGDLSGGGAQMFAARFAGGWVRSGGPAALFVTGQEPDHPAVRAALLPEVPVIEAGEIEARGLGAVMRDHSLDLAVTGHWWADRAMGGWLEAMAPEARPPWAIVMHGCHETVLDHPGGFSDRREVWDRAERLCGLWVWTAEKNRRLFEEGHVAPRRIAHVVNGFEPVRPSGLTRARLGLPEGALVLTLASRAIEAKGWAVALEAFRAAREAAPEGREVRLVLIGDGPAAEAIGETARREGPVPGLHLVPHTGRLADYIALSDVGLLPSWFPGESLPLVLIEMLAQGKPAIVSDIGMCPWAIGGRAPEGPAGVVVPRGGDGRVGAAPLAAAMARFVEDRGLAARLEPQARAAFAKFDFERMLGAYREAFAELMRAAG